MDNRGRSISITQEQKEAIEEAYDYLWEHVQEAFLDPLGKGPSPIDTRIVATALELNIPVVTDDQDMIELAREFQVKTISSLGLMKLMKEAGHIDDEKVDMVVDQWMYDNDTPYKDWKKEFKKLFGREAPKGY